MKNEMMKMLENDIQNNFTKLYDFNDDFELKLIKYSENIIFKICFKSNDNNDVVFRIHRPGYHNLEELESEMIWMDEIANDTDISLPLVYKGRNGKIIQELHTSGGKVLNCSLISFLEGEIVGSLEGEQLVLAIKQLGEITAKLHIQAINRDENIKLNRFSWDGKNIFGDGVWGRWDKYPEMTSEDRILLEECQKKIQLKLDYYGRTKQHYGIIHSDLHFFNVIQKDGINQIFDFDDCGYGFYMYDLGCTLVTYSQNISKLKYAWVEGYESVRKLSIEDKSMLDTFILLRRIVRLAWLTSHWESDTRKNMDKDYYKITIKMAKKWNERN